jgi:deoxyribonuclease V
MKQRNIKKAQKNNHAWNVAPTEARAIQKEIQSQLQFKPLPKNIRFIAGADVSFNKYEKDVYAGIIVLSWPDLKPVEHACVKMEVNFPYVPGLLSFREIPPLLEVWKHIKNIPDVIMVDGHGIAHPRRLGIAAHFGLVTNTPTLGAAKKLLYGVFEKPLEQLSAEMGDFTYILDPKTGERLGAALRTKRNVKPMLISPGHLCTLEDAMMIAKKTARGYRLPEPTRLAHNLVNLFRTGKLPLKSDMSNISHSIY